MRHLLLTLGVAAVAGCAKTEKPAAAPAAPPPAPAPAPPPPINMADVTGKWTVKVMPMDKDSVILTYEMDATADPTKWAINFAKRKPVMVKATASGDSLMMDAGPYQSMLRKGQMVSTHTVAHMKDGKMMGMTTAHYKTKGADSVIMLRTEGTKNP